MVDIERISKKIREEKDNLIAKAFTCQISSLLLTNGIVPIMTEYSFEDLKTITDSDRYKLVYELGITFDSLDTSKHDEKVYNQALDDLVRLVCEYYTMQERAGYCADTNNMIKQRIADFAEQLKEQR